MKESDQTVKWRIVLLTAALGLIGFVLELGPVAGVFPLASQGPSVFTGLSIELISLGFLAYFSLAASAAIGLHPTEEEPTPKKEPPPKAATPTPSPATGEGESIQEHVRARPDLHQLRMLVTALVGYILLKALSLFFAWLLVDNRLTQTQIALAFRFGFFYILICWFLLWQFLRWYAWRRRWIRLQEELIGMDVARVMAVVILIVPIFYIISALWKGDLFNGPLNVLALLLHLTLIAFSIILWFATPIKLKRTIIALTITGGVVIILTFILAMLEHFWVTP